MRAWNKCTTPDPSQLHMNSPLSVNKAYRELRALRAEQRQRLQPLSGEYLAQGLRRYSSIGAEYVSRIRSIIRSRQLDRLDQQYKVPGYRR